jgi:hypothetical protein
VPAPIASRPRTSPVESSGIRCLITLRLSCGRALRLGRSHSVPVVSQHFSGDGAFTL